MQSFHLSLIAVFFLFCGCSPKSAKDLPPAAGLQEALNNFESEYFTNGPLKGAIVGIIRNDKREVYAFGYRDIEQALAPDLFTTFEIGSISKTFTATMLAQAVLSGKCTLDAPAQNYLPAGEVSVPAFEDTVITLEDLATHTSGLPRMPANIGLYLFKNPDNPYASYPVSELYRSLSNTKLKTPPGNNFAYSNMGFGLLGHILGRIHQSDYETSLRETVLAPLGMNHTTLVLTDSQRLNLALPYEKSKKISNWDFTDAFAGAGAIKSNLNDMFLYLEAQMGLSTSPLDSAIAFSHIPRRPDGGSGKVGLGWMISDPEKGQTTIWHNGATGGYQSFLGFYPDSKTGVIVLSNTSTPSMQEATKAGFYLLKAAAKQ
ncbi:MAG: serine hydrolase domain-containing protein [Bacteroidia bacterium]